MSRRAEYCGHRQNRAEFDPEAEKESSNYFQFAPIALECVEDILSIRARWLTEFWSIPIRLRILAPGHEGAQREVFGCLTNLASE
jgi:uncharacterized membrane protein